MSDVKTKWVQSKVFSDFTGVQFKKRSVLEWFLEETFSEQEAQSFLIKEAKKRLNVYEGIYVKQSGICLIDTKVCENGMKT